MRRKNNLIILVFSFLFVCCKNKNEISNKNIKATFTKEKTEFSLIEDFNCDGNLDTLKIINKEDKNHEMVINVFGNNQPFISKNIIFQNENLYTGDKKNNISILYKKNTINLIQEYGSSSPEGWYTCYINYNKYTNTFVVDSVNQSSKNFAAKSDEDFIRSKTKILKINLENFDAQKEFNNF